MKLVVAFFLLVDVVFSGGVFAQAPKHKTDFVLQKKLEMMVSEFEGVAGIYVYHKDKGVVAGINQDSLYPSASMIKIPILLRIFDRIEQGELDINDELTYQKNYAYPYDTDIVNSFEMGSKISINKLLNLMLIFSDNSASIWLQDVAGYGVAINDWLKTNGFIHTRVNTKTYGREWFEMRHGWGTTTPREMTDLLLGIYDKKFVSKDASEKMIRILSRSYWDGEALSQIPPNTFMLSKQGAIARSKSEVVGVQAEHGTYFFCVITDQQKKQSFDYNDPGFVFIREVSRTLYEYFEPQDKWKPSNDLEKYW
ncbi:serine hydrolase [bacterium]|nr:MAG: serine hydrolase [bacterium]